MKRLATLFALAITLSFAAPAIAQKAPRKAKATNVDVAKKRIKDAIFTEGDTLEGDRPAGDGDRVSARGNANHTTLIKLRWHFNDKIIKSAEDLI